jgi:hypothetical protein
MCIAIVITITISIDIINTFLSLILGHVSKIIVQIHRLSLLSWSLSRWSITNTYGPTLLQTFLWQTESNYSRFHAYKSTSAYVAISHEERSSAHNDDILSSPYAPIVSDTYPATAMRTQSPQAFHNDPP